jgi:hypothetical protein
MKHIIVSCLVALVLVAGGGLAATGAVYANFQEAPLSIPAPPPPFLVAI